MPTLENSESLQKSLVIVDILGPSHPRVPTPFIFVIDYGIIGLGGGTMNVSPFTGALLCLLAGAIFVYLSYLIAFRLIRWIKKTLSPEDMWRSLYVAIAIVLSLFALSCAILFLSKGVTLLLWPDT